jgi:hypothetical protein
MPQIEHRIAIVELSPRFVDLHGVLFNMYVRRVRSGGLMYKVPESILTEP